MQQTDAIPYESAAQRELDPLVVRATGKIGLDRARAGQLQRVDIEVLDPDRGCPGRVHGQPVELRAATSE